MIEILFGTGNIFRKQQFTFLGSPMTRICMVNEIITFFQMACPIKYPPYPNGAFYIFTATVSTLFFVSCNVVTYNFAFIPTVFNIIVTILKREYINTLSLEPIFGVLTKAKPLLDLYFLPGGLFVVVSWVVGCGFVVDSPEY